MIRIAAILAVLFISGAANAQGIVTTTPLPVTSVVSPDSVSVTNTFKSAIAASATRKGCQLQNLSGNTIYVYIGAIASATTPKSMQLTTKLTFNCAHSGIVLTDQISVTGTAGDGYVIVRQ